MSALAVGDRVHWTSQAQGNTKTKHGVIVCYIPPGERPDKYTFPDLHKGVGCGYGRTTESYVVAVDGKHYWPIANKLRLSAVRVACGGSGIKP